MNLARYYMEFVPQDRPCPIMEILFCAERDCELHYMDAPLNLKDMGLCHSEEGDRISLDWDDMISASESLERDYLD